MRYRSRSLIAVVALAFLLLPFVAVQAQAGVTVTAQVQASVREGPSRQTKIVANMPENATAPALARSQDNAWIQVTYNGATGWVAVRQVTVHGDINTLPVSASTGSAAGPAAPAAATPVRPANTRSLALTERRILRWITSIDTDATSVTIQNNQLVLTEHSKTSGDAVGYFNVSVVDGKLAATLTTLSSAQDGTHPASDFQQDAINKLNTEFSDSLNGLFKAWVGVRTIVSVELDPGQLVIFYAR